MIEAFYTTSFKVLLDDHTIDSGGALTDEDTTESGQAKGHLQTLTGNERIENAKRESASTHRLFCPLDVAISESNKVEIDDKTYDVTFINKLNIGINPHQEVDLELLQ